jgi:glucose/arabinose dehydrogenase
MLQAEIRTMRLPWCFALCIALLASLVLGSSGLSLTQEKKAKQQPDKQTSGDFDADKFFGAPADRAKRATPAKSLRLPEGFKAQLLYTVPLDRQGSWVCLTADPKGRLIASAESGKLYRITPPPVSGGGETKVEPINLAIGNAQGLLCAFDSLYVVMSSDKSGLYRVRDTDGDDQYDRVELLRRFEGRSEHGPHAVVLSPSRDALYIVGGNASYPDPPPDASAFLASWSEDRLQKRIGASDGTLSPKRPGGWVCRTDPQGKHFSLVAMGFRNPYDLAFNSDGELFTFDSDMEWDAGTPWYRPTRVNHVIKGVDFGWRAGTAKWPDDYLDSLGSVVDIGFSSPTGLTFGQGAKFPAVTRRLYSQGTGAMAISTRSILNPTARPTKGRPSVLSAARRCR